MSSLEKVFIKEFKKNIRGMMVSKDIFKVPLPDEVKTWDISKGDVLAVKDIPSDLDKYYSCLNNSIVTKIPSGVSVKKRKIDLITRNFAKDRDGKFIYEDVKIPSGSIPVVSKKNLQIPYGYRSDTFGYIDFTVTNGVREFIYVVPKKYLYKVNETALALSVKNMKNYYGKGYLTWKFGTVYLHVIPYNHSRKYVGTKILKTSYKLNYEEEVKCIIDYWVNNDVVPNISLCNTVEEGNLVLKETSKGYDCYNPIESISLGDIDIYGQDE